MASCDSTSWQKTNPNGSGGSQGKSESRVCFYSVRRVHALINHSPVCCLCCSFDWSTFWAALTHINLLQVFILNRQMARGNYIYAKCSATWLSPLSSLITTKWVIVFFPACVRVRVCSIVYKVTVSRWLLGASWHSAACQDAVAEVMSVSAGAPGACN